MGSASPDVFFAVVNNYRYCFGMFTCLFSGRQAYEKNFNATWSGKIFQKRGTPTSPKLALQRVLEICCVLIFPHQVELNKFHRPKDHEVSTQKIFKW